MRRNQSRNASDHPACIQEPIDAILRHEQRQDRAGHDDCDQGPEFDCPSLVIVPTGTIPRSPWLRSQGGGIAESRDPVLHSLRRIVPSEQLR